MHRALVVGTLFAGSSLVASAQVLIPGVDFENADIREALTSLARYARQRVVVDPDVRGAITISMRLHNFDTVLQQCVRQVDSVYRIRPDGSYLVFRIPTDEVPRWLAQAVHEMFPDHPDDPFTPDPKLDKNDIRNVLGEYFGSRGVFSLDPQVVGIVKRPATPMPTTKLLAFYLEQLNATYTVEAGIYRILPKNRKP
ncbi:MAG TPA: hypothetical protein VK934_05160 [Fimbriimonas sp.]|nr:hypothetical protein [Fimbriimonas sp.]